MNLKVVARVLSFVLLVITCFMFIPLVVSLTGWGYHGVADSATVWVVSILAGLATVIVLSLAGGAWWRIFGPGGAYSRVRDGGGCAPIAVALWGGASDELGMREGAAIVSFAWVIASVLGAMPYVLSGVLYAGMTALEAEILERRPAFLPQASLRVSSGSLDEY